MGMWIGYTHLINLFMKKVRIYKNFLIHAYLCRYPITLVRSRLIFYYHPTKNWRILREGLEFFKLRKRIKFRFKPIHFTGIPPGPRLLCHESLIMTLIEGNLFDIAGTLWGDSDRRRWISVVKSRWKTAVKWFLLLCWTNATTLMWCQGNV